MLTMVDDNSWTRHQRRTVGTIIRLYSQRRRDSNKLETSFKRTMSEYGHLNRRQRLKKQNETDMYDDDTRSPSPSTMKLPNDASQRRDSNTSTDSQKSIKKPPSIDEIQDLYSALQDLVKTNVTTTPLPERRAKLIKISPLGSPKPGRLGERTLTVPERALRKLSSKVSSSSSSSVDKEQYEFSHKHKRGLSAGTIDAVANLMKISPFPSRKFSQDIESTKEEKKSLKVPSINGKSKKKDRLPRNSSQFEQKKWKLFSRLRTKSNAELSDDCDDKISTDEDELNSPQNNRRLSEADAIKLRKFREQDSHLYLAHRKSLQEETKREIQQLVDNFNLEICDSHPKTPKIKSPENELNRLESWFEQAAAEALNQRPEQCEDESSSDPNESLDITDSRCRKKNSNRRNGGIKRASSNASSRNRDERKARRERLISNKALKHAKSTPDLSTEDDVLNDTGITYKVVGQLHHANSNKVKELSPRSKSMFGDGTVGRLPDTPVFYMPSNENETKLRENKYENSMKQNVDTGIFYTEKESMEKSFLSPVEKSRSESLSTMKTNEPLKQKRPKSMFAYFDEDVVIDNNESIKNSLNVQTDTNANFCRANIISSSHTLSLCDLSKSTIVQEKSLWDRFRKASSAKKTKPVVA